MGRGSQYHTALPEPFVTWPWDLGDFFSLLVPVFGFPPWSHAMLVTHQPLTNYSEAFGR